MIGQIAGLVARFIINLFKFHKSKLLTVLFSAIVFFVVLFPFEDLTDLVTEKIAIATNNQVFLTFEDLDLSLFPAPAFSLKNVKIETPTLPAIEAGYLSIAPSVSSFLAFKKGVVTRADDFFKGQLKLTYSEGETTSNKIQMHNIGLSASEIEVAELKKFLDVPIRVKGKISIDADAKIDFTFEEQPEGELKLTSKTLTLPESNLPTPFGDLPFPKMNFSSLNFKARIVGGEIILEEVTLGESTDPIFARIKGKLGLKLTKRGPQIIPVYSNYDFKTQLEVKKNSGKTLSLFLNFIDTYKTAGSNSDTYLFRARGPSFGPPPSLSQLKTFE